MKTLLLVIGLLLSVKDLAALSPPWYTLWNEIRATIGRDPTIQIDPLDTTSMPFVINIHVADSVKAQALASFLPSLYTIGNITVAIRISGAGGTAPTTPADWSSAIRAALEANPLFVSAYAPANSSSVRVTFAKSIVQFSNDDIGELYGNYNRPAVETFGDIGGQFAGQPARIPWVTGTAPFAIANAASHGHPLAAPNTILTIMGPEADCGSGLHLTVNGVAAQVLYASTTQINFVIPGDAATSGGTTLRMVCDQTGAAASLMLNAEQTSPALFTAAQSGTGQASILNTDYSPNTAATPAARGSVVYVFGTGFGPAKIQNAPGLAELVLPVTATIGSLSTDAPTAFIAPGGTSGLQEIMIRVPPNAPTGPSVPIVLQVGGRSSQAGTTIAIN